MSDAIRCGLFLVMIVAFEMALTCLISWGIVLVFAGFGVAIPYWPTVGAVMLVQLLLSLMHGGKS